jgi:hypothetical protein
MREITWEQKLTLSHVLNEHAVLGVSRDTMTNEIRTARFPALWRLVPAVKKVVQLIHDAAVPQPHERLLD